MAAAATTTRKPGSTVRGRNDEQAMRESPVAIRQPGQLCVAALDGRLADTDAHAIQDGGLADEGGLVAGDAAGPDDVQAAEEVRERRYCRHPRAFLLGSVTITTAAPLSLAAIVTTTTTGLTVQDVRRRQRVRLRQPARDQL